MLSPHFKVRLCNFQLDSPIASARAQPPYVLRGRVDDRPFNTRGFVSATMRPTWDDVIEIDYVAPSIEQLTTKYLIVECYGGESFLGSCRIPLYQIATGPTSYHLPLLDGVRELGKLDFHCSFELVTEVTIQLSQLRIDSLPRLGYDEAPNPYLAYSLGHAGEVRESPIAGGARGPEWRALAPLYFKGTYAQLCAQKIVITLKHCRNGFSVSHTDPTMATLLLPLDKLPIEPRMCSVPFRERFHSDPGFPFPFSAEISGLAEFRNVHSVIQLAAGVRSESGVIGGVAAVGARSPPRMESHGLPAAVRATSPPRHPGGRSSGVSSTFDMSYIPPPQQQHPQHTSYHSAAAGNGSSFASGVNYSSYVPPSQAPPTNLSAHVSVPLPAVAPADLEVLDEVTSKQSALLSKVDGRLQEITRRKAEVASQIAAQKVAEESEMESASQRKLQLDSDLRNALLEKDRLEEHLRSIQLRREEESRIAVQQAAERERAKRALEEEQQEALVMQQRVVQLRNEMTRHLEEEERRYQQRVREAEEARRRTQEDANALADLEARLAEAELRATVRQKEEQARSARRPLSPSRHR